MRAKLGRRGRCPEGGCSAALTVLQPVSPSLTWKRRPRATCVAVAEHASARVSFMRAGRCRGGGFVCPRLHVLQANTRARTRRSRCEHTTAFSVDGRVQVRNSRPRRAQRKNVVGPLGLQVGLSRRRQDQRCSRARTLLPPARGRSSAAPNRCEHPARLACRAQRSCGGASRGIKQTRGAAN